MTLTNQQLPPPNPTLLLRHHTRPSSRPSTVHSNPSPSTLRGMSLAVDGLSVVATPEERMLFYSQKVPPSSLLPYPLPPSPHCC